MKKVFFLLTIFSILSLCITAQTNHIVAIDSEGIKLDKSKVNVPCSPAQTSPYKCSIDAVVKIRTNLISPAGNLTYEYSVTGGFIIGKGRNVKWDLSEALPETYVVTVTVKNSKCFQKTFTETVKALSCPGCARWDYFCPNLAIYGPIESVKRGDEVTFTASVTGAGDYEVLYKWRVTGGKIISSQGKPFIKVKVGKSVNKLTAQIKISGVHAAYCVNTATETIKILPKQ